MSLSLVYRLIGWWCLLCVLAACGSNTESVPPASTPLATATPETIIQTNPTEGLAAVVNGDTITIADLEKRIQFYQAGNTYEAADYEALVSYLLESLIDQKLIEQAAVTLGISITEEQVQAEIAALQAEAEKQNLTAEDFFAQQGISPADYPIQVRETLLSQAVNNQVTATVPTTGPQVHARHILVSEEATARDILTQLENGADFVELARQYSLDPSTREAGGDLGWISQGDLLQAEVEAVIFALPPQTRAPDPIQSILGYHIVESIERVEDRTLDPEQIAMQRQQAWSQWLEEQRLTATITRYVGQAANQP